LRQRGVRRRASREPTRQPSSHGWTKSRPQ
jgi:hypothetical protein